MDISCCTPCRPRNLRSWLLPRLCVSLKLLVPTIRAPEAKCSFLLNRKLGLCFLRYPRLRVLQDERTWWWAYLSWPALWSHEGTSYCSGGPARWRCVSPDIPKHSFGTNH